jgi:hypothetical protein
MAKHNNYYYYYYYYYYYNNPFLNCVKKNLTYHSRKRAVLSLISIENMLVKQQDGEVHQAAWEPLRS